MNTKKIFAVISGAALLLTSCNWVLEEHPKTIYTPDYFTTQAGVSIRPCSSRTWATISSTRSQLSSRQ